MKETQPESWAKFEANHKSNPDAVFLKRLAEELDRVGALDVLRKGFKDINATFKMAQFALAHALNPKTSEDYRKNRLRVVRQLHYSEHNENCIDLVLFLNGIPVATLELKTDTTQPVWNAIRQYKYDRLPVDPKSREKEPLLQFGRRALVHFATSCDEVYMATRLEGKKTFFLPFNQGRDGSAGNPANPNRYATSYLWEEIFRKDVWMLILGRYLHLERKETVDSITGKKSIKETLIFPRFHQLDAVRALLAQTKAEGVGGTFLIQHSAGSGKSNTIAWTSHQLASLHDAEDRKIFGSVIVITDRKVLDSQLQDTIYQFEHQHGVVQKIDDNRKRKARTRKRISAPRTSSTRWSPRANARPMSPITPSPRHRRPRLSSYLVNRSRMASRPRSMSTPCARPLRKVSSSTCSSTTPPTMCSGSFPRSVTTSSWNLARPGSRLPAT
ncbi:type I restriction endonuclease [Methylocaldum sp.]|uniref:type I restriction endonuclease n=1 Tax=Methylocaldum sp. TaxID=1969727 RepID=UPI002D443FA4|nr:type I restriction endonuclease [Methylocaldum sp.]HYE35711.1 type I restriction endonuclease [Methylocaldum sp.]